MSEKKEIRTASTKQENRRGVPKSKIRSDRRERAERKKKFKSTIIVSSISVFAFLVIASLVLPGLLGGRSSAKFREPLPYNAAGPTESMQDYGNQKIIVGSSHAPYQTQPATSGAQWAIRPDIDELAPYGAPVKWGEYDEVIPDEALLHNLAHGGIGLHYNCPEGCKDIVDKLRELKNIDDVQIVLSPYTGMKTKIAITSWRHLLKLEKFDEAKIKEFIKAYRDRAPESWIGNYWGDAIQ